MIIPIDDPADARIELYRDIRERDLVGRASLFVAEGKVVIEKLAASRAYRPQSLLISAHRIDRLGDLLARLADETPVYAASQAVIDAVAGFPLHRGLLAIGSRLTQPTAEQILASAPPRADILILSGIANHDNMGGIFRNAAAFGADAILLDADCCDPLYRKAIRVSVGATLLVPFARLPRATDLIGLLEHHGFVPVALTPQGNVDLADLVVARRNAILLGAEGPGLSADLLAQATTVRIAMLHDFDSLNVATTSGIVLHHLVSADRRSRR